METTDRINCSLISVIVPVYNGEAYLDRCVRSVLFQDYHNLELILVDGASTDGTLKLCRVWQKKDERVRVIPARVNKGVSAGRNTGIREARGEFFFFLDADDWLVPDCLSRLHAELLAEEADIAGCGFARCTNADWETLYKRVRQGADEPDGGGKTDGEPAVKRVLRGNAFLQEGILKQDTRCWSKLYRRSLVEGHFFREDYTIGEDMLFLWEVSAKADRIVSISYPGYCYYHNPQGTMLRPFRLSDMDQIRCWKVIMDYLQENETDTSVIVSAAAILAMSCMLTVGKLAGLPAEQRKQYREQRRQCSEVLHETLKIPGAYGRLDRGYRLKVRLYGALPEVYLLLYHLIKSR